MTHALRIDRLWTRGFRNLHDLELSPGQRFNVLWGDNGQGKSNLLEAIDYLATLDSFRGASSAELIAKGRDDSILAAEVHAELTPHRCKIKLSRHSQRSVELDQKRPRSRSNYLGVMPTVLFHPGDMQLVAGSPEQRRAFLDRLLEQYDAVYASTRSAYDRALRSRNRLLKSEPRDVRAITAYDELLASAGAIIGQARDKLISEIAPRVTDAFANIGGEAQRLLVRYEPRCTPELETLRAALASSLDKDLARGFTAEGPHGDELGLFLDGTAAKRYASQGQQRSIVLALKVAELLELEKRTHKVPILLLDDVSSELDRGRNRRLFELLSSLGGQVFLTTTQPELILTEGDRRDFHVSAGTVTVS